MRFTTLGLAMLASTALASAASAQDAFTQEDLFKVRHVGQAAMSPDGEKVAYSLSRIRDVLNGEENGTARSEIRIATGNGQNKLYLPESMGAYSLDWRDETTLTFLAKGDNGKTALFALSTEGGAPEQIFSWPEGIRSYDFADNGSVLFFSATDPADKKQEALEKKGFDANIIDEDYRYTDLYRYDFGAGETTPFDLDGQVSSFDASEDGEQVVVALAPTPLIGDDIINKTYHIVDGDSGNVESVIKTEGKIGKATFSPDGRRIAMLAGVDRSDPVAQTLAIVNARNGEFYFPLKDDANQINFVWDGNDRLTVLAHRGTASEHYQMALDGTAISETTVHEGFIARNLTASNGNYAMAADAPNHPRELFVTNYAGALEKWTNHNAWIEGRKLGNQEVVTWTARDGLEIEGILVTPEGRAPRGGWPLITLVHGGPEAHYSNGWVTRYSDPGHFGANMGYAVFYPNYRGSTGRGIDFAKLDHADKPAEEFNDVIDGIEALAEAGTINKDKVGITGGSYGGYASAWGATALSDHFAASVVFVALTDLISFMGTTDIPEEMIDSHFMVYPEGNWQMYLEQSPIYHASNNKTPTLILHGEADPRVHPAQSLELFRYLKRVGNAPVRLVTYPNEGHGNRRAAAQYDYSLRLMRWMDSFLKDGAEEMPPYELEKVRALTE